MGAGPAVTLPIFDAGRLRGNLAGKNADYDVAVEQYNQTLADAMREVVDQLASFKSVDEQRVQAASRRSLTAQEAYDLALLRYREGIGNYLQVLSAESPLLAQQSLDADLRSRQLALSINLIRALGGGFDDRAVGDGRGALIDADEERKRHGNSRRIAGLQLCRGLAEKAVLAEGLPGHRRGHGRSLASHVCRDMGQRAGSDLVERRAF